MFSRENIVSQENIGFLENIDFLENICFLENLGFPENLGFLESLCFLENHVETWGNVGSLFLVFKLFLIDIQTPGHIWGLPNMVGFWSNYSLFRKLIHRFTQKK